MKMEGMMIAAQGRKVRAVGWFASGIVAGGAAAWAVETMLDSIGAASLIAFVIGLMGGLRAAIVWFE